MGGLSIWHWAALAAIVLVVLGSTRIPGVMAELAKGIKAFRSNLSDDGPDSKDPPSRA
jgi:sec-independent protein translocase protein TatA